MKGGKGGEMAWTPPGGGGHLAGGTVCTPILPTPSHQASPSGPDAVDVAAPIPTDLATCTAELVQTRAALAETRRQRDALKAAVAAIATAATAATSAVAIM